VDTLIVFKETKILPLWLPNFLFICLFFILSVSPSNCHAVLLFVYLSFFLSSLNRAWPWRKFDFVHIWDTLCFSEHFYFLIDIWNLPLMIINSKSKLSIIDTFESKKRRFFIKCNGWAFLSNIISSAIKCIKHNKQQLARYQKIFKDDDRWQI